MYRPMGKKLAWSHRQVVRRGLKSKYRTRSRYKYRLVTTPSGARAFSGRYRRRRKPRRF